MMNMLDFDLLVKYTLQHNLAQNQSCHVKNDWTEINPFFNLFVSKLLIENFDSNLTPKHQESDYNKKHGHALFVAVEVFLLIQKFIHSRSSRLKLDKVRINSPLKALY